MPRWTRALLVVGALVAVPPTAHLAAILQEQPAQQQEAPMCDARVIEGRYSGRVLFDDGQDAERVGLVVTAEGQEKYAATLYHGGLPDERAGPLPDLGTVALTGSCRDFTLVLTGEIPLRLQYIHSRFTALDEANDYRGHLVRVAQ
jgi:hypothetical protein